MSNNYQPADDNTVRVYMPGQDQYPAYYWKDAAKTDLATTAGDLIRAVDSGMILGPTWVNYGNEDARRPALGSDGGVQFAGTGATENGLQIASSQALINTILSTGYADIGWMFKCDSGFGFTSSAMIDNNGFSTTARGLHLGTVAVNTSHAALRIYWGNGSSNLLTLQTEEEVDNSAWNRARLHVEPGNGNSWLQVGNGARVYGTLTGSLLTGNAASSLFIGRRGAAGTPFKGQLKNIRIGTAWGTETYAGSEEAWQLDSPAGPITGDPELSSTNIHLNLNKTYYYCPRFIYFNGQAISDQTDTDGAVYSWNSIWTGSGHGADDPLGVETVISATVTTDGTTETIADGERYVGGSVSMTRETSTIAFSSQIQTVTVAGNAKYERIRMTKNSTSGTMGRFYPIRNTRAASFEDYLALDEDGAELESGTLDAADGSEHFMPSGTIAVAQWSSSLSVMALQVMTKGTELTGFRHLILDTPQNKRIYQNLNGYNPSNGQTCELASVTKFYDTTAGAWEALAASEMQTILAGVGSINQRFGMRMGIGF